MCLFHLIKTQTMHVFVIPYSSCPADSQGACAAEPGQGGDGREREEPGVPEGSAAQGHHPVSGDGEVIAAVFSWTCCWGGPRGKGLFFSEDHHWQSCAVLGKTLTIIDENLAVVFWGKILTRYNRHWKLRGWREGEWDIVLRKRWKCGWSSGKQAGVCFSIPPGDRIIGIVVEASTLRVEDPGFNSCLHHGDFSRLSHSIDLEIGTPVATLPGA